MTEEPTTLLPPSGDKIMNFLDEMRLEGIISDLQLKIVALEAQVEALNAKLLSFEQENN